MSIANDSYLARVIIVEHFDNLINLVDVKTETLIVNDLTKANRLNQERKAILDSIVQLQETALSQSSGKHFQTAFEAKFEQTIQSDTIKYIDKLDLFKSDLIHRDGLLITDSKHLIGVSLWIVNFYASEEIMQYLTRHAEPSFRCASFQLKFNSEIQLTSDKLRTFLFLNETFTQSKTIVNDLADFDLSKVSKFEFQLNSDLNFSLDSNALAPFNNLTQVTLCKFNLTIDSNCFVDLVNLTSLDLHSLKLEQVPNLGNNLNLERIDLSNNKIKVLDSNCFAGLDQLKSLDLYNNCIDTLPSEVFRDLVGLEKLYLCCRTSTLHEATFLNCRNLRVLNLYDNEFESLPAGLFRNQSKLEVLELDTGKMESLGEGIFAGLDNLKLLRLTCKHLRHLSSDTLRGLLKLERFDCNHNNTISQAEQDNFRDSFQRVNLTCIIFMEMNF